MGLIQMSMFDDTYMVDCPHCGYHFSLMTALRNVKDYEKAAALVLCHPILQVVPPATRDFMARCPIPFLAGVPMGVSFLEKQTNYCVSGVHKHLQRLVWAEIARPIPKLTHRKPGSQKRHYCQYQVILALVDENRENTVKNIDRIPATLEHVAV